MAKLQGEHVLTMTTGGVLERREPSEPGEGCITLREPTNEEWNKYDGSRFEFSKKGRLKKNNQAAAKCALFDNLVVSITEIEDGKGQITIDDLERIPARYKQRAVFLCFEDETADDEDDELEKN